MPVVKTKVDFSDPLKLPFLRIRPLNSGASFCNRLYEQKLLFLDPNSR